MPIYQSRRPRRRRVVRRRRLPVIARGLRAPVPTKMRVKLTYTEFVKLTPGGAGSAAINVYSGNGMYDPNISGVGHQPRGFDELMALYDHYVVTGSTCTVSFVNTGTAEANICFIRLKDKQTEDSDLVANTEAAYSKYALYAVNQQHPNTNHNYNLVSRANVGKFLGRGNVLSDPELKGTTSANPTEQCYFHVGAVGLDSAAAGSVTDCFVTIQYTAWLIEPKQPTQS